MDPASEHSSPTFPSVEFAFMAPVGSFEQQFQLNYPPPHSSAYDLPPTTVPTNDPLPFSSMSMHPAYSYGQHPGVFHPPPPGPRSYTPAVVSPSALSPPRSSSHSDRSSSSKGSSSQGEASASPAASPASEGSTPPAMANLSLSHMPPAAPAHHSRSQSGNSSSTSQRSNGSMRYVPVGGGGGGGGGRGGGSGAESRGRKRRATRRDEDDDSDEDEQDEVPAHRSHSQNQRDVEARREEIRKQRIESEQRRRDELREGYRRLKDCLPVSNQKSSKVSLLDRATVHIRFVEDQNRALQNKLHQTELELQRLRTVNEQLMINTVTTANEQRNAAFGAH